MDVNFLMNSVKTLRCKRDLLPMLIENVRELTVLAKNLRVNVEALSKQNTDLENKAREIRTRDTFSATESTREEAVFHALAIL